jgi:hypothetical protein
VPAGNQFHAIRPDDGRGPLAYDFSHGKEVSGVKESTMLDFDNDNVIHMSTSVRTTSPEAVKTLEQARQRRREELAGWQPSAGWLAQRNVTRQAHANGR